MGEMEINETLIQIRVQNLHIVGWIIPEKKQLAKIELGFEENVLQVKISVDMEAIVNYQLIELLKEFKDIFAWIYKDQKVIPLDIV